MFRRFDGPPPNSEENDTDIENWSFPSSYERFSSVNKPKSRLGRRRTQIEPSTNFKDVKTSTMDNNETKFGYKASHGSSIYPKTPSHTHPVNNCRTPVFKRCDNTQKSSLVLEETDQKKSSFETPLRNETHFPLQEINNFPTTLRITAKPVPEEDKSGENTSETVAKILNKSFECENGVVKKDLSDFFATSNLPEAHIDSSQSDICNNSSFMTARDFNFEKVKPLQESVFLKTPGKGYGLFNMLTSPLDPLAAVLTDDETDTDKETVKKTPSHYNSAKTPYKFQPLREMYTPSLKRISETPKLFSHTPGELLKNSSPLRKHKECHETYPQSFFQNLSDTCLNSSVDVKHLNRSGQKQKPPGSSWKCGSVEKKNVGPSPLGRTAEDKDSYVNSVKRQIFEGLGWSCGPVNSYMSSGNLALLNSEKEESIEKPPTSLSRDVPELMDIDDSYSLSCENQGPNNGQLEDECLLRTNVMESVNNMSINLHEVSPEHEKDPPKSPKKLPENEPQGFRETLDLSGVVSLPEERGLGTPDEDSGKKTVVRIFPDEELQLPPHEEITVRKVEKAVVDSVISKGTATVNEILPIVQSCAPNVSCSKPKQVNKSHPIFGDNLETVVLKENLQTLQSTAQNGSFKERKEVQKSSPTCFDNVETVVLQEELPILQSDGGGRSSREAGKEASRSACPSPGLPRPHHQLPFGFPRPQAVRPASNIVYVNNRPYTVMSMLGRGGSSEVYQVLETNESKLMAMKIVNLSSVEETIAKGYLNEIEVLLKLQGCPSVIRMFDHEYLKESKMLYVVMEKGDTDFSRLMKDILKTKKISVAMITYYWTEMLNAVKDIHDKGIIHSDLKPANFLLVSGRLKLIDFGIASSLQGDMTSVLKDVTTGTFNYMSPEAIRNSGEGKGYKITYKSDVWSLGCILYNLVYGRTPFSHLTNTWSKLQAIADPQRSVAFPPSPSNLPPNIILSLRWALKKEAKERPTAGELLQLAEYTPGAESQLGRQICALIAENIAQIFPNCNVKYELERRPKGEKPPSSPPATS